MMHQSQPLQDLIKAAIRSKQQRDGRELTLKQIAGHLRLDDARFSTYHTGRRVPPPHVTAKMAAYFFNIEREKKQFVDAIAHVRSESRVGGRAAHGSLLERL